MDIEAGLFGVGFVESADCTSGDVVFMHLNGEDNMQISSPFCRWKSTGPSRVECKLLFSEEQKNLLDNLERNSGKIKTKFESFSLVYYNLGAIFGASANCSNDIYVLYRYMLVHGYLCIEAWEMKIPMEN